MQREPLLLLVCLVLGSAVASSARAEPRWVASAKKLLTKPSSSRPATNAVNPRPAPAPAAPQSAAEPAPAVAAPAVAAPAVAAPAVAAPIVEAPPPAPPAVEPTHVAEATPKATTDGYASLKVVDWRSYVESHPDHQYDADEEGEDGCCDEKFLGVKILSEGTLPVALLHGGRTGRRVELKWDYFYFAALKGGKLIDFDPGRKSLAVPGYGWASPEEKQATVANDELILPYTLSKQYSGKPEAIALTYWKLVGKQFVEQVKRRQITKGK